MKIDCKFLIDTNVVIGLEDNHQVNRAFSAFARKCSTFGIRLFTHDAVNDDICRDKDDRRKSITLSKLAKFENISSLPNENKSLLERIYGPLPKINDHCDARLLNALYEGVVDFLISEDLGLHKRADIVNLGDKVFSVQEALTWITSTFEPKVVSLPNISEKKAHEIPKDSPIFVSLRDDYAGFDQWFQKCISQHRTCWVVEEDSNIAGIVIRNDETYKEAQTTHPGPKILKICTFKMQPKYRGRKFGEQLLKQIFWHAQSNDYDLIYLTAFPRQTELIGLLEYFGFIVRDTLENGEMRLERVIDKNIPELNGLSPIEYARTTYPRFYDGDKIGKFCIPIQGLYHETLFPEIAHKPQMSLFELEGLNKKTPGNTIRKVYICHAKIKKLKPGDILFFYVSKTNNYNASQSITTIGIVENVLECNDPNELRQQVGKRSVFSDSQLEELAASNTKTSKVINFLLVGHMKNNITLSKLVKLQIFNRRPPQSIAEITGARYSVLKQFLDLGGLM